MIKNNSENRLVLSMVFATRSFWTYTFFNATKFIIFLYEFFDKFFTSIKSQTRAVSVLNICFLAFKKINGFWMCPINDFSTGNP